MEKTIKDESYKVLVVDDDKSTREAIEDFLQHQNQNLAIKTASDGYTALDLVKAENFDIIITDLKMPGMDGLEVLKSVKEIEPDAVVILVTGYATVETAIEAMKHGAYDYITKPFRLEELLIVIKNACERVRLKRQNKAMLEELRKSYEEIDRLKKSAGYHGASNGQGAFIEKRRSGAVVLELERLARLKESGLITDEEINMLKKRFF
ncbi:MAG: sigma-54-dependent Fis family transcriptional regulator [Deltaproteobacteria bacterium]|nr:sigma-54-dependent Fis family transcriptional regulator [Deltaproteobacteria bacterium]